MTAVAKRLHPHWDMKTANQHIQGGASLDELKKARDKVRKCMQEFEKYANQVQGTSVQEEFLKELAKDRPVFSLLSNTIGQEERIEGISGCGCVIA